MGSRIFMRVPHGPLDDVGLYSIAIGPRSNDVGPRSIDVGKGSIDVGDPCGDSQGGGMGIGPQGLFWAPRVVKK